MWIVVVAIILNFIISFALLYSFDSVELWDPGEYHTNEFRLTQPKVYDLIEPSELDIERYVENEICPAYYYFILRSEIEEANKEAGGTTSFYYTPIFLAPIFLVSTSGLYSIGFTQSKFLCYVISLALCVAIRAVASLIYKKTLKMPDCNMNKEPFAKHFEWRKEYKGGNEYKEFNVSDETALNSEILNAHLSYLISIKDAVQRRKVVRSFVSVLGAAMYLLLFVSEP